MRIVLNDVDPSVSERGPVDDETLARLYAYPDVDRWLRANMVGTLDGAATGADGKTGSINNEADHVVFTLLRTLADVIVVGAGTARSEGYGRPRPVRGERAVLREGRAPAPALAVVSRTANLPPRVTLPDEHEGAGEVLLVTCGLADEAAVAAAREALGPEQVLVLGDDEVDLVAMAEQLAARGMSRMLTEGGPRLLRDLAAAGVLDEVCLTVVPRLIAGEHPRILTGDGVDVSLAPRLLLEADGTLLGRWQRPERA
ncbi:MAG TPA: dihydrofolate reductase family protein [Nocardioidaceae bacterium]